MTLADRTPSRSRSRLQTSPWSHWSSRARVGSQRLVFTKDQCVDTLEQMKWLSYSGWKRVELQVYGRNWNLPLQAESYCWTCGFWWRCLLDFKISLRFHWTSAGSIWAFRSQNPQWRVPTPSQVPRRCSQSPTHRRHVYRWSLLRAALEICTNAWRHTLWV